MPTIGSLVIVSCTNAKKVRFAMRLRSRLKKVRMNYALARNITLTELDYATSTTTRTIEDVWSLHWQTSSTHHATMFSYTITTAMCVHEEPCVVKEWTKEVAESYCPDVYRGR